MSTIDINDLSEYLICPFKLSFPNTEQKLDTFYKIKKTIYSNLFDYGMYTRAIEQDITVSKLRERINILWNDLKPNIVYSLSIPERLSIYNKLSYLAGFFNSFDKVKYYGIINKVEMEDMTILFESTTVVKDTQYTSYVKLNGTHMGLQDCSPVIRILSNMVYWNMEYIPKKNNNVVLFRTDTGDTYSQVLLSKKDTHNMLSNIVLGIQNKVHFPRNDYIACSTCVHKLNCIWNLDDK